MLSTLTAVVCLGFIAWAIAGADYSYSPSGSTSGESSGIGYMLIAIAGIPVAILGVIGTGLFFLGKALMWILSVLSEALPSIAAMIGSALKKLSAFLMGASRSFMRLIAFLFDALGSALRGLLKLLIAPAKIVAAAVAMIKAIGSLFGRLLSIVITFAKAALRFIVRLFSSLGRFVKTVARAVRNVLSMAMTAMKNLLVFVGDIVAWVLSMISSVFSRIIKPLMRFALFRMLFGGIKNVSAMLLRWIKASIAFIKDVVSWILAMGAKFLSIPLKAPAQLRPFRRIAAAVAGTIALLLNGLKQAGGLIGDVLSFVLSALKNGFTSVFGSLPIAKTIRALVGAPLRFIRFLRDALSVGFAGILGALRGARDVFASSGSVLKAAARFFGDIGSLFASALLHGKKLFISLVSIAAEMLRGVARTAEGLFSILKKASSGAVRFGTEILSMVAAAAKGALVSLKSIPVIGGIIFEAIQSVFGALKTGFGVVKTAMRSVFRLVANAVAQAVGFVGSMGAAVMAAAALLMSILRGSGSFGADVADMLSAFAAFMVTGARRILAFFALTSFAPIVRMFFGDASKEEESALHEEDDGKTKRVFVFSASASAKSFDDERSAKEPVARIERMVVIPSLSASKTTVSNAESSGVDGRIDDLSRRLRALKRGSVHSGRFSSRTETSVSIGKKTVTPVERLRLGERTAEHRTQFLQDIGWFVRRELQNKAKL